MTNSYVTLPIIKKRKKELKLSKKRKSKKLEIRVI